MELSYRPLEPNEYRLLKDFLYHAIYIPEGVAPPDRSLVESPELRKYYETFGREGDNSLLAVHNQQILGAIWGRVWKESEKGYGFIREDYPEISLSVLPLYRGLGIGKQLLDRYIEWAKKNNLPGLSLSVSKDNYAVRLYEKAGFIVACEDESDYIMRLDLSAGPTE